MILIFKDELETEFTISDTPLVNAKIMHTMLRFTVV